MANTTLSEDFVFDLIQSEDQFPVDFDQAWRWIGYAKKQNAKDKLVKNFEERFDYRFTQMRESAPAGGLTHWDDIRLSVDCFKSLAMMAGTAKGKEVRKYFLDCERRLKKLTRQPKQQSQPAKSLDRQLYEFFEEWKAAQILFRGPVKPNGKKRTETDLRMEFYVNFINHRLTALPAALKVVPLALLTYQKFCRLIANYQRKVGSSQKPGFLEGQDFRIFLENQEKSGRGHPAQEIKLTVEVSVNPRQSGCRFS